MAYVPDPSNSSQPVDSVKASTAAAEFRALKAYIATLAGLTVPTALPALTLQQLNGGQLAGLRNKIINGKMDIAQRGSSFVAIASGAYSLDRWQWGNTSSAVVTVSAASDTPSGNEFRDSLRVQVTTADTSILGTEDALVQQSIEGFNVRDLIGRTFTISFWVRSSKVGIHTLVIFNSVADRRFISEYSVTVANTWEYKTITIFGGLITAGTWNWANGAGLTCRWNLAAGPGSAAVPGSWVTAGTSTVNQVNCLDTIGNLFAITGVQVEVGSVATPFEHRPVGLELALCQRYYEVMRVVARGIAQAGGFIATPGYFKVNKRVPPTLTPAGTTSIINVSAESALDITVSEFRYTIVAITGGIDTAIINREYWAAAEL